MLHQNVSRGNRQHDQLLITGLEPNAIHTLEIRPIFEPQELRIESICPCWW